MITRKDEFGIVDLGATLDLVPRQFRLITGMDLFENPSRHLNNCSDRAC